MAEMEEPVLFSKNFKVCLKSAEWSLILLIVSHPLRTFYALKEDIVTNLRFLGRIFFRFVVPFFLLSGQILIFSLFYSNM